MFPTSRCLIGRLASLAAVVGLAVCLAAPASADAGRKLAQALSDSMLPLSVLIPAGMIQARSRNTHHNGERVADAVVADGVIAGAMQKIFHGGRPDDPTATDGFPSGHTADAFALATSLGDCYHNLRVPGYLWAVGVGWSRHRLRRHYWYEVVAGAAVGFAIARWSRSRDDGLCQGLFVSDDPASAPAFAAHASGLSLPGGPALRWTKSW